MKKYPLTPEGVQAKQDELYKLDEGDLQRQAILISKDSATWISDNFAISEEQQQYLDQLKDDFKLPLGWQIASVIIGRRPFTFEPIPDDTTQETNRKKKTEVTISGSTTVNPTTGQTSTTITGGIKWTW